MPSQIRHAVLSRAELAEREKFAATLRRWRIDLDLTQGEVGQRIDPSNPNAKNYVSRVETNDFGNFGMYPLGLHCRALGRTRIDLLLESGVERPRSGAVESEDPLLDAIEAEGLLASTRDILTAVVGVGRAQAREAGLSAVQAAERRDLARQVGVPETMLDAWVRLTDEQREDVGRYLSNLAAANEETPAPSKGRRRRKGS